MASDEQQKLLKLEDPSGPSIWEAAVSCSGRGRQFAHRTHACPQARTCRAVLCCQLNASVRSAASSSQADKRDAPPADAWEYQARTGMHHSQSHNAHTHARTHAANAPWQHAAHTCSQMRKAARDAVFSNLAYVPYSPRMPVSRDDPAAWMWVRCNQGRRVPQLAAGYACMRACVDACRRLLNARRRCSHCVLLCCCARRSASDAGGAHATRAHRARDSTDMPWLLIGTQ